MTSPVRVEELFFEASLLPPEERARFLDQACSGDSLLRRQVDELLTADRVAGPFLAPPAGPGPANAPEPDPRIGHTTGGWRLLELLGVGGMGRVYRAEKSDGSFRVSAALKIIRTGLATDDVRRRFRRERRVLASLDHPNIARLLDGGAAEDGSPFFVMELVIGVPLDRYVREAGLSIEARLRLFLSVCGAVEYAHRSLVVHRDLKPGNIIVTPAGEPKLLDFGISRVLDPASEEDDGVTAVAARAMTPGYASPEQLRGESVGTAGDVYALGVILYELLTGRRPFETGGRSPAEVERMILAQPPTRPSAVVGAGSGKADVARGRARRLSGDLDTIVLKALHRDPDRRYASVEALAADIQRHLDGFPVLARGDAVAYRLSRFVQRNRAAVAAATAVALVLVGTTLLSLILLQQARIARSEAGRRAAAAREVTRVLQDLLAGADPLATSRKDPTVRDVLDRAARRLESEPPHDPEVAAALHFTLGDALQHLGDLHAARRHFVQAQARYAEAGLDESEEAVATMRKRARVASGLGAADSAAVLAEQAVALGERVLPLVHPEQLRSLRELARIRQAAGSWDEAEAIHRRVVADVGRIEPQGGEQTFGALNDLAMLLVSQQKLEESTTLAKRALEMARLTKGPRSYAAAQISQNLGWALTRNGRHAEAEPHLREALSIYTEILEPEHSLRATARLNLAMALLKLGQGEESVRTLTEIVEEWRRRLGPAHNDVATALSNLATALLETGRPLDAAARYAEARAIYQQNLGAEHPWVAIVHYSEATAFRRAGRFDLAEAHARDALSIRRRALKPGHPDLARSLVLLGSILLDRVRPAEARLLLEEARALVDSTATLRGEIDAALARVTG